MQNINKRKFVFRAFVSIVAFGLAFYDIDLLIKVFYFDLTYFKLYHILWFLLMLGMIQVCIPIFNNHVSCGKMFAKHFKANTTFYDKEALKEHTRRNNLGAVRAGIFWSVLLAVIGLLYFRNLIDKITIHLIVVFFYFSDQFCINIWCPFRSWIVKNKCCNTCRIFNWGHFMIFSPYIFIPTFWTYSLLMMSITILIQWEYMHFKHPYRFSEISNANLQCINCLKAKCRYIGGTT